jgi:hypothetical protein
MACAEGHAPPLGEIGKIRREDKKKGSDLDERSPSSRELRGRVNQKW